MNENNPYQLFMDWLSNVTTEEIKKEIDRAINLFQSYNPTGYFDNLTLDLVENSDERDGTYVAEYINAIIIAYQDTLPAFGIHLGEVIPLTHLRHLNDLFESILALEDYEDAVALVTIRQLGYSQREIFLQLIEQISPETDIGQLSEILDVVTPLFYERFDAVIGPRAQLQQQQLDGQELSLMNELTSLYGKVSTVFSQTDILRQSPDFLYHFRQAMEYLSNHDDVSWIDGLVDCSEKLENMHDEKMIRFHWNHENAAAYHASYAYVLGYYRHQLDQTQLEQLIQTHCEETLEYTNIAASPIHRQRYHHLVQEYLKKLLEGN